jgi:flagellar M-ring protein FliF
MSTSQKTEDLSNSGSPGGVPGTPSNLPRSTIKPLAGPGSGSGMSRRTESMAFETSRSVRQVKMPRGSIKRVSVAVLLDQDFVWQGQGKQRKHVLTAPPPERIKAIHDIVVGVLGIQADRGDQVVIESLPFEQTLALEDVGNETSAKGDKSTPLTPLAKLLADRRVQIGAGVTILLLLIAVVFLMKGKKKKGSVEMGHPALAAGSVATSGTKATQEISASSRDADGNVKEIREVREVAQISQVRDGGDGAVQVAGGQSPSLAALPISAKLALPEMDSATRMMLHQIQEHVAKDPAFAATIIRGWMSEE